MKTGIYWQNPAYPAKGMDFIFDPSLVLYLPLYKLDGASFMSKDKHGHLCTVTGALWTPRGRSFDGADDYIDAGNGASLDTTDAITIEAWVYGYDMSGSRLLATKWDAGTNNRSYALNLDGASPTFWLSPDGSSFTTLNSNFPLNVNQWYHLVGVYDGSYMHIYVDGAQKKSVSYGLDIYVSTATFWLGSSVSGFGGPRWFNGLIGEVRIYNRMLTPLEIQHNYLATKWRYQ